MATARTHKKARYDSQYTLDPNSSLDATPFQPILTSSTSLFPPPGAALAHKDPMSYFPEEIATHIFEALSPADLGKCATVSKLWHRLVNDQILWQQLFIKYGFISPRGLTIVPGHRPSSSHEHTNSNILTRKRKRTTPQRQLQQRQYQLTSRAQCWKALYRLNYNWTMGQATVSTLAMNDLWLCDQDVLLRQSLSRTAEGSSRMEEMQDVIHGMSMQGDGSSRIVRFKGQVILVTSPQGMVQLWRIRDEAGRLQMGVQEQKPEYWQTYTCPRIPDGGGLGPPQITCLALDTSGDKTRGQDWQRVLVGYASGHFSIFQYYQGPNQDHSPAAAVVEEVGATTQLVAWSEVGAVQSACFRYPVVATCSQEDGAISIYRIQESEGGANTDPQHWCRLLHRLYGTPTQSPVEMELSQISSAGSDPSTEIGQSSNSSKRLGMWRVLVSFGLELFDDNSWTVRVQEIEFDELVILLSQETGAAGESVSSSLDPTLAFQERDGSSFEPVCPEAVVDHPRIGAISALSISWPYVVTTHFDNTLNVFEMYRMAGRGRGGQGKGAKQRPRLVFQHTSTLYGHCGAVSSVSIEPVSGRLVSASMDRSIKIWTLVPPPPRRSGERIRRHGSLFSSFFGQRQQRQQRQYQCSVSMSDINKSWTKAGQVTKEEGQGHAWVGADEEKVVSVSCDGSIKVWQFV